MKIKIKSIEVKQKEGKRARGDYGDLTRLAKSIKEHGLMHPIVVDKATSGDKEYILIAGERRLRAAVLIGLSEIEATLVSQTTALERKAMELEENVIRKDLTWPEEVECLRQLHELRQQMYGAATRAKDNVGWGARETAEAVGRSLGSVGGDLRLATVLKERPELLKKVRKLPKVAAMKIVQRMVEAEELKRQMDKKELVITADLRLGDCCDLIDEIEDHSVDCLLTDPPFGNPGIVKTGQTHVSSYNVTESNVSTLETMFPVYKVLIPKLAKKLKIGAHVYIFCGMGEAYCFLMKTLAENGFLMDDLPLIWYKKRSSVIGKDFHYLSSYQACLFGHNQERKRPLKKPINNVIIAATIAPQMKVHPLQITDAVLRPLIENSTVPGELVLDCFAGSGAVLKTAEQLQRRAIGFELDEGNYLRAIKWLSETKGEQNET